MTVDEAIAGPAAESPATHYRYPGSPPFLDDDLDRQLFRGRDEEADIVLHSILSANLFLLYSQSGLGKSSLLNARVMHELRERGRWPVAVRLNDPDVEPVVAIRTQIEEAALADPDVELVSTAGTDGDTAAPATFWDLLSSLEVWRGNELQELVLVLDQFEELFTLRRDDGERRRFITEFGEVVRGHRHDVAQAGAAAIPPKVRFVVVVREDALGELQAVENDIPQILRNRVRLLPLDRASARAAIVEPAMLDDDRLHGPRFEYSEAAVTEILDFLSSNSAGTVTADGSIDPSQLQIVCQYVERTIVPRKAGAGAGPVRIDAADLEGRAGLDQVLSRFYRRTIESLPGDQAHRAEALCEQGLINREGRRLSLEQGQIVDEYGVTLVTLQALVDGRLLRADPRVGSVYYELAHDTLVPAIRADREARLARRRRRRNRLLAALVALAVLVGLVATAIIASSGSGDGGPSDVVAPPPPPPSLAAGEQDTATLDAATPSREFTVTAAGAAPLEVRVEPDPNLDVVVVATDAAGGTRSQDQLGNGGVERLVIPRGTETDDEYVIQVTSLAPPDAGFTIAVGEIEPDDLAVGEASSGAIAAEGDVAVYSLTLGDGDQAIVDVVPQLEDAAEASGDTEAKATLDPTIELIDPTSDESRSIVDAGGPGVAERAIVSRPGPTLVVVRGKTTTGGFTIEVTDKSPEVPIGQATAGAIDQVGAVSEFSFAAEPGAAHAVLVAPDLQLDGVLGITGGSEPRTVDRVRQGRPELAVVVADGADVDLQVSGFESSVGSFDLTVSPAATQPEPDAAVSGSGLAVYDVPLAEGETKLLSVAPAADTTEIELVWFAPDGAIAGTALSSGDQPASLTIDGAAGPHRVVVVPRSTVEGEAPSGYVVTSTSEQAYNDAFAALLDDIAALEQRTEQYGTDRTALEAELFGGDPVADPGQDFAATLNAYQAGHRELAEQYASDVQPMIAALEAAPLPESPFGDLDAVRDAAVRHYRSWLDFVDEYQRAIELWTFDVLGGRTTENLVDDARNRMRPFIDETANSFTDLCTALSDEQPPSGSFQGTIAAECES